jgi:hypothetical protein
MKYIDNCIRSLIAEAKTLERTMKPIYKKKNIQKRPISASACSQSPVPLVRASNHTPSRRPKPTLSKKAKPLLPAAAAGVADDADDEAAMAAPAARRIVGAEVPIPGSDKLRWIDLTIPSSSAAAPASPSDPFVCVPPRAASGCHIIPSGDSQYYLSWYVLGASPHFRALYYGSVQMSDTLC